MTAADGKFTISGLDPGTYEITAWHERLGTQTASVTVTGGILLSAAAILPRFEFRTVTNLASGYGGNAASSGGWRAGATESWSRRR